MKLLSLAVFTTSIFAAPPPKNTILNVLPITNLDIAMRHCNYIVQATPIQQSDDFNFKLVNALNGTFSDHQLRPFFFVVGNATILPSFTVLIRYNDRYIS